MATSPVQAAVPTAVLQTRGSTRAREHCVAWHETNNGWRVVVRHCAEEADTGKGCERLCSCRLLRGVSAQPEEPGEPPTTVLKHHKREKSHLLFGQFDLLEILFSDWIHMSNVAPQGQQGSGTHGGKDEGQLQGRGQQEPCPAPQGIHADSLTHVDWGLPTFSPKGPPGGCLGIEGRMSLPQILDAAGVGCASSRRQ